MSKKGLYRIDVAFLDTYSGYQDGEPVTVTTDVVWIKGNMQPWNKGITVDITTAGDVFKDWRTLYTKELPNLTISQPLPPSPQKGSSYVYYDAKWYKIIGTQDWSNQAKGVKHFELLLQKSVAPDGVPNPIPVNNLVRDFERAIQELNQTTIIIEDL